LSAPTAWLAASRLRVAVSSVACATTSVCINLFARRNGVRTQGGVIVTMRQQCSLKSKNRLGAIVPRCNDAQT
jgi:hypothetical protein